MIPGLGQSNYGDVVHGGAVMTFIDIALYAGGKMAGIADVRAVTLDCAVQFVSPGKLDIPLDANVELMRETRRLAFLRGTVEQEAGIVAAFSATLRKLGEPE
jgi:uncharacterized protein (TIGR00369 family)